MRNFKLLAGALCLSLGLATANADNNTGLTIIGLHDNQLPLFANTPDTYAFIVKNNSSTSGFTITDKWIRHDANLNTTPANPQEVECTDYITPNQICNITINISDNIINDTGIFNLVLKGTQDGNEAAYNSNPIPYHVYN